MLQCHLCQTWAHYKCIDEHQKDITGIWCCNSCRVLPNTVALLCEKVSDLQQNMQALLFLACSTIARTESGINNVCGSTLVSRPPSQTIDHQTPVTTPEAATHTDAPTDTEEDSTNIDRELIDIHTQTPERINRTRDIHDGPRRYVPKRNHDIYMHVPSSRITEGAVRSYLQDIGVTDIIRVSKLSKEGYESEFRIIIGDASISDTVYGRREFRKDTRLMSFKRYRANIRTPTHHHGKTENIRRNEINISKHEIETPRNNYTQRNRKHGRADNVVPHDLSISHQVRPNVAARSASIDNQSVPIHAHLSANSQQSRFQTKTPLLPYPPPTHTQSSFPCLDLPGQSTSNQPLQFQDESYPVSPTSNVTYQTYLNPTSPHVRYQDTSNGDPSAMHPMTSQSYPHSRYGTLSTNVCICRSSSISSGHNSTHATYSKYAVPIPD